MKKNLVKIIIPCILITTLLMGCSFSSSSVVETNTTLADIVDEAETDNTEYETETAEMEVVSDVEHWAGDEDGDTADDVESMYASVLSTADSTDESEEDDTDSEDTSSVTEAETETTTASSDSEDETEADTTTASGSTSSSSSNKSSSNSTSSSSSSNNSSSSSSSDSSSSSSSSNKSFSSSSSNSSSSSSSSNKSSSSSSSNSTSSSSSSNKSSSSSSSNSTSSSNSSNKSTSSSSAETETTTSHTHTYEAVYKTVHHAATYSYETVVDGYTYKCSACSFSCSCEGSDTDTLEALEEEIYAHIKEAHGAGGGFLIYTITHDEEILETEEYDEEVLQYYKCSGCGDVISEDEYNAL